MFSLVFLSECWFGSSGLRACDCLFWQWVCPGHGIFFHKICCCPVCYHSLSSVRKKLWLGKKISCGVNRNTSALFMVWEEELLYGFLIISPFNEKWKPQRFVTCEKCCVPCVCVCVWTGWRHTQGVSRATLLWGRSLRRAPNHRHYPDPHCCAIPALKRLCTVPVRLGRHYHTIIHSFRPSYYIHEHSLELCSRLPRVEI